MGRCSLLLNHMTRRVPTPVLCKARLGIMLNICGALPFGEGAQEGLWKPCAVAFPPALHCSALSHALKS